MLLSAVAGWAQYDSTGNPIVQWRTYREGSTCAIDKFTTRILVTEGDFQRYWTEFCGNRQAAAPTDIDWTKEIVVAIHLGRRSTSGYRTYVETCRIREAMLEIYYVEETPHRSGRPSKFDSSPYVMIRMQRTVGTPKFIGRTQTARITVGSNSCTCRTPCNRCTCGCTCCGQPEYPFRVDYFSFDTGLQCTVNAPSVFFITTEDEFFDYWCNVLEKPEREYRRGSVDFTREVVIGIHLGTRNTGGYSVRITDFEATAPGRATLRYSEIPPRGIAAQVITSPYAVVVAPKGIGRISVAKNVGVPMGR